MINISFTGSRQGMTARQKETLEFILHHLTSEKYMLNRPEEINFHHGGAVGADEEAHDIVLKIPHMFNIVRPVGEERWNYWQNEKRGYRIVLDWKDDPLERNQDIVMAGNILFACPRTREEELRSGTWHTIRFAKKKRRRCIILDP